MAKQITTLVRDIYDGLSKPTSQEFRQRVSEGVATRLASQLRHYQDKGGQRLSKVGPMCPRAYWYSVHRPNCAETPPPWALFKFQYGHVIEALAIAHAKEAGHEVAGEQDELTFLGVRGHRDCVIDGCTVDVKSCSSYQLEKFKKGTISEADDFGYLDQLDAYVCGTSVEDPYCKVLDRGYILAIDKTLGHLVLYEHKVRPERIEERIRSLTSIANRDSPPTCECGTRPDGASGNIALDVKASYSAFKHQCFPTLRTFLYATGPKYLCHVVRVPEVPEITSKGILISS
jgi:hypothetical protein